MFTQTFVIACIAAIASADVHSENKLATVMSNLAQTKSQSQTFGLAQILAKNTVKATDDSDKHYIATDVDNEIVPDANSNAQMLAQVEQSSGHTCHSSQDRNKAPLVDFFSIYEGSEMYSDDDFMADNDALYWADMGEYMSSSQITWTRASEAFPNHTLFGADGVQADDIEQGSLGNCWFLAACATMAQIPGSVEEMFLNSSNAISTNGIYAVNFYTLGMPHTVIVDDFLPLNAYGNTYFAGLGDNQDRGDEGSLWVPIIEKAFAKYHGNYEHIEGGDARAAARTMGNHPQDITNHSADDESKAANWTKLTEHSDQGHILMSGTPAGSDRDTNTDGIVQGHAYNMLGYVVLSDGTRLIHMQNPWGNERFIGDWSDSSDLWTDATKQEAGYIDRNDGAFFMSYDHYWEQFSETYYNFNAQNWSSASFLMLDDDSVGNAEAEHNLTLTSSVAQTIYLTAHTWDARCMADQCEDWDYQNAGYHSVYVGAAYYNYIFKYGARQIEFEIEADTPTNVRTRWDWTDERKANDWSVVAFGAEGTLTLTLDGYESDVMPVIGGSHDGSAPPTPPPSPPTPPPSPPTPPSPPSPPVEEEESPEFIEFQNWCENYEVANWAGQDCGVSLMESASYTADGDFYWKTIIKNTCDWVSLELTVWMDEDEWANLQHFYSRTNDDGSLMYDSIILNMEDPETDSDGYVGLRFRVGSVSDTEEFGVTSSEQQIAAWENQPGDYGMRYYSNLSWVM